MAVAVDSAAVEDLLSGSNYKKSKPSVPDGFSLVLVSAKGL
jgi:hypothetical protein